MNNKPDEKPYPFRQGEFGLSEDVLRAVPLAGLSAPDPFLLINSGDIPPAPKVRGYLLPGDKGYVPHKTVPEEEL
ncbi:MAG: hypothetical protein AAB574_00830 [Patescibacteria group bacterium]